MMNIIEKMKKDLEERNLDPHTIVAADNNGKMQILSYDNGVLQFISPKFEVLRAYESDKGEAAMRPLMNIQIPL